MTRIVSRLSLTTMAVTLLALAVPLAAPMAAQANDELSQRVQAANQVLKDFQAIPEQAIPPNLLNQAYAVAVVPNVIKGAFVVGGSYGKGVLLVRHSDGTWSNPAFIRLGDISLGLQWGAQGSDLVLVFRSPRGLNNIARGKFTLGGSASASAGPVGRTARAMTDGEFKSEIYAYARSRGAFIGFAMDGGVITIDQLANATWYGNTTDGAAARIFSDRNIATPPGAQPLLDTLASMAPQLDWKDAALARQAPATPAPAAGTTSTESTTYAVEDGAEPDPETRF
jgi:lipid-binding SYLF domain-containing protein